MDFRIVLIKHGKGRIVFRIGLMSLEIGPVKPRMGLVKLRKGLIELGICQIEPAARNRSDSARDRSKNNNIRRTVLARVSGLVKNFATCSEGVFFGAACEKL